MMLIDAKYDIGDMVYLKTDSEQLQRIVTRVNVFKNGELMYQLSCGANSSDHYDFEISIERNIISTP